jgi:hypothetical protein
MFRNLFTTACLTALENQSDLLLGGAPRLTRLTRTTTPATTSRAPAFSLTRMLAVAPLLAVVVLLALTGWLPVMLLAVVLLLPALAPVVLVILGILATHDVERRQAACGQGTLVN